MFLLPDLWDAPTTTTTTNDNNNNDNDDNDNKTNNNTTNNHNTNDNNMNSDNSSLWDARGAAHQENLVHLGRADARVLHVIDYTNNTVML